MLEVADDRLRAETKRIHPWGHRDQFRLDFARVRDREIHGQPSLDGALSPKSLVDPEHDLDVAPA